MKTTIPQHDVIIVGAGPVGLVLALILQAHGHKPVVIERQADQYGLPRAVGIFHQAVEVFNTLGLHDELFESAIADPGDLVDKVAVVECGQGKVLARIPMKNQLKTGQPDVYDLHQPSLERILEDTCLGRGVEIIRSTMVTSVRDQTTHVEVTAEGPRGHMQLSARFVVGCDGARSTVRRCAGVKFVQHNGVNSRWLVVDVVPKSPEAMASWKDARVAKQILNPRRTMTSVPAPPRRRRWEIMLQPEESIAEAQTPEFIWPLLFEFGCNPDNAAIERKATYEMEGGWCESFHKGRIMLAGDAAHIAPPFLAQGLNSGIRDSTNLSWRLGFALRYPEKNWQRLFEDYTIEQVGTTQRFVTEAIMLEKLFCVTDPDAATERDKLISSGTLPWPDLGILGWPGMYVADPSLGTGRHFPEDVICIDNVNRRLYEISQWGWVLLLAEQAGDGFEESLAASTIQLFKEVLNGTCLTVGPNHCEDVSGTIQEYLRENGLAAVLIRPDRYVYGGAKSAGDVEGLIQGVVNYTEPIPLT